MRRPRGDLRSSARSPSTHMFEERAHGVEKSTARPISRRALGSGLFQLCMELRKRVRRGATLFMRLRPVAWQKGDALAAPVFHDDDALLTLGVHSRRNSRSGGKRHGRKETSRYARLRAGTSGSCRHCGYAARTLPSWMMSSGMPAPFPPHRIEPDPDLGRVPRTMSTISALRTVTPGAFWRSAGG